ncbi:MAG: AMP-binding protein [Fulvivirga sp.]
MTDHRYSILMTAANIPLMETSTRDEIQDNQLNALKELLHYASRRSAFYQRHFKTNNIDVNTINSLTDLARIPTTDKNDLQRYQRELWCVSAKDIVEYCSTSGTEGKAVTAPLTAGDIKRLTYNEAISLACAGGDPNETYQLTTTVDRQFMAGLAYTLGARALGAGMVRVGPGLPQLQWKTIEEVKPTALIVVPSFLIKLIEFAEKEGIDYQESSIRKAICIGEPVRNNDFSYNAAGRRITEKWNITLYSTYASTEMATAFTECEQGRGGHLHPELVIAEILDEKGAAVNPGEVGELTITTLGVEGMPLIRFKTGDMCALYTEPCSCGRNTPRVGPVVGRKHQLIKYKGTTCYPPALFDLLDNDSRIKLYQVIASSDNFGNDQLTVRYAVSGALDKMQLADNFKAQLRVTPELEEVALGQLFSDVHPKTSRKPVKFLDNR